MLFRSVYPLFHQIIRLLLLHVMFDSPPNLAVELWLKYDCLPLSPHIFVTLVYYLIQIPKVCHLEIYRIFQNADASLKPY